MLNNLGGRSNFFDDPSDWLPVVRELYNVGKYLYPKFKQWGSKRIKQGIFGILKILFGFWFWGLGIFLGVEFYLRLSPSSILVTYLPGTFEFWQVFGMHLIVWICTFLAILVMLIGALQFIAATGKWRGRVERIVTLLVKTVFTKKFREKYISNLV